MSRSWPRPAQSVAKQKWRSSFRADLSRTFWFGGLETGGWGDRGICLIIVWGRVVLEREFTRGGGKQRNVCRCLGGCRGGAVLREKRGIWVRIGTWGSFRIGSFSGNGVAGIGARSCLWTVNEGGFERFEGLFHPRVGGAGYQGNHGR